MPELPDLEVIRAVLTRRLSGKRVKEMQVLRPIVLRSLLREERAETVLAGRTLKVVGRRGKFLLLVFDQGLWVAVNPMLAGRLRLSVGPTRRRTRDYVVLEFEDGTELCYYDIKGQGKVYVTRDLALIPGYARLGPEPLDPDLTQDVFLARLEGYRGQVKGVLTRGALVAGIGNAYADEILFEAGIYPFRRVGTLSGAERESLYAAMTHVLAQAVEILSQRVGDGIPTELRDHLKVHNRRGEPCPRCGNQISEIKVDRRATSFCRHCQPGSLFE